MEMLSDTSESLNRKDREGRAKDAKKTYRTQGPFPQRSLFLAFFAAFLGGSLRWGFSALDGDALGHQRKP
jgi:hypothetical protein